MRYLTTLLLAIALAGSTWAQQQDTPPSIGAGASTLSEGSNLPLEEVGNDDLLGINVYDAPELTRAVRVDSNGDIHLPMLRSPIHVAGLDPADLEKVIAAALVNGKVMVDPIVTVSVVEYRSHPISVVGAVKTPATFQATGSVTLLDAITQAGGLAENAGPEILVSRTVTGPDGKGEKQVQHVAVKSLIGTADPTSNIILHGGEEILVPPAGRFYVVGNVKSPGAFSITNGAKSSVLKALALSQGLQPYASNVAYIYRANGSGGSINEIPVELKRIMKRKSPDVALMGNDILYIPDNSGRRHTMTAMKTALLFGAGLSGVVLYLIFQ